MGFMKKPYTLFKRAKAWYYKLPDEKTYHSTGKTAKAVAESYVTRLIKEGKTGGGRRIKLKNFVPGFFEQTGDWVEKRKQKDKSFSPVMSQLRTGHLNNYILPEFGDRYLDEVEAFEIDDWLLTSKKYTTGEPLANGTKNSLMNTFGLVLKEAKRKGLIIFNPVDDIERLGDNYRERKPFDIEEIKTMFPPEDDRLLEIWESYYWASIYYLMLTSGMRSGEIRALLWKHIDWKICVVLIVRAVKAEGIIAQTKSKEQRGTLVPERTMDLLHKWRDETPFPNAEDLIFYGLGNGNQTLEGSTMVDHFKDGLLRAGVEGQGRTPHCLRHTYNTRMEKLLPEAILRYMIGHRSRAMTQRYLHVTPEERLKEYLPVQKQIDSAWE